MQVKNIVAVTGEYTNKQGETKKQYLTIGKLLTKDDGKMSVKMECTPLMRDGWASVYDQQKDDAKKPTDKITPPTEDVPFR